MHELSATESILSLALNEAARIGAARVTRIRLKTGEWSTFEPDCLRFYFGILAAGTRAEGAELDVDVIPARFVCEACGIEYSPAHGRFTCPTCFAARGKLISGREFYVDSLEVEHADTAGTKSPGCQ